MTAVDLAARVSSGRDFADGAKNTFGARRVIYAATEDPVAKVVVPRLTVAGADLSKISFLEGVMQTDTVEDDRQTFKTRFALDKHMLQLEEEFKVRPDTALIVFDPLPSYDGEADGNKDAEIRPLLEQLAAVCEKHKVTVVGIIHVNKRGDGGALQKILGASSVAGVARAAFMFSKDPDDKDEHHMSPIKANVGERRAGLKYRIESADYQTAAGKTANTARVVWCGDSEEDADDVLARQPERSRERREDTKIEKAKAWLFERIGGGLEQN